MKREIVECDIGGMVHHGEIISRKVPIMFDYDQEDGRSSQPPYLEFSHLDICSGCWSFMTAKRRIVYGYGAQGHNDYNLKFKDEK